MSFFSLTNHYLRSHGSLFAAMLTASLLVLTPAPSLADSGNDDYLTTPVLTLAESTPARGAAPGEVESFTMALANQAIQPSENLKPLLPAGSVCESATVDGKVLMVRFVVPAGTVMGDGELETLNMILVRYVVMSQDLAELRMEAREASPAGVAVRTTPTAATARPLHSFVPAPPPIPTPIPSSDEPAATQAPDYSKLYKELQKQTDPGAANRAAGQNSIATGSQPAGVLSGRTIFFSGGHGYTSDDAGSWATQRGFSMGMNEDFGNLDQINYFASLVFNAGGTVVAMRPLGHQDNEVVLDNTSSDVTFTPSAAAWTLASSSTDNYGNSTGNDMRYISSQPTETATATYAPNIPEAGWYPVYCFANASNNRCSGQLYRIKHSAGESQVRVNHRRVGRGWVWLGNYYFAAGKNSATGSVVISNVTPSPGTAGSIAEHSTLSGYEREAECARYWLQASEAPSSVYDPSTTDINDNVSAPPRMAAYMQQDDGQGYNGDIYLGYHSNAYLGTSRGSVGLITSAATVTNQATWAALCSDTLDTMANIEDANWEFTWGAYGNSTLTASYGEIGSGLNGQMCGTIIEVAFHDNLTDAKLMRDPKVRYVIARSQLHAAIKYFNQFDGGAIAYPSEPPQRVRVTNLAGGMRVAWAPVAATSAGPQAATGYRVYTSTDGRNFILAQSVAGYSNTQAVLTGIPQGEVKYVRVTATNAGGESSPSNVVAARATDGKTNPPVLIVDGYDRLDRFNNVPRFPANSEDTWCERLFPRRNNSYDYAREAASSIAAAGRYFDMSSNESIIAGDVSLTNYETVVWMTGEEDAANQTLDATERSRIESFLAAGNSSHNSQGRKLFISGSNLAAHLDTGGAAATFYNGQLRADAAGRTTSNYSATGSAGGALAGVNVTFAPGPETYDVEAADILATSGGSTVLMSYSGTPGGTFSFEPFDAIGSWVDPNFSGSTNADLASTFNINTSVKRQGSGSGELYYVWGTGNLIREYSGNRPSLPSDAVLSVWVYGDNSGNNISFGVRDPDDGEIFENLPMTINFTGWRQMTWNLASDPRTRFAGAGDNTFTGATAQLDAIMLRKVGAAASGTIYVDDMTYPTAPGVSPGPAAVSYTSGANRVVTFGFPFEAITSDSQRNLLVNGAFNSLGTSYNVPVSLSAFEVE
jgi:hypothetical protein